jgi:uncharacterized protein with NRDE domain
MCLLAVFFRVVDEAPLVVGANREEAYARGGEPPQLLAGALRAVGGVDPQQRGTWLGVNERGVLAAVTNRPRSRVPDRPRSRGLLVQDLLGCGSAREAADLAVRELDRNRYAGCNVLCADPDGAHVVHAGDWLRARPLPPGLHVLTAGDVNDIRDPRIGYALSWLGERTYQTADQCVAALRELCAQGGDGHPPVCLHGVQGGTVSSSIVAVRLPLATGTYLHAQGPPDATPYADYAHLLRELTSPRAEGR